MQYVKELKEILLNDAVFPQWFFNELSFLHKLSVENYYLEVAELIALYTSLTANADIYRYFTPKARQHLYPYLSNKILVQQIDISVLSAISKVIDVDKEQIKDNATPQLSKIRKQIQDKIHEINAVFRRVLSQLKNQNILADTEESIRDGRRRVLSVKAEFKRSVKGLITDESDSEEILRISSRMKQFSSTMN
ncbi:MAG: hypothetical protein R2807_05820 [Chitinophagales bacterium]